MFFDRLSRYLNNHHFASFLSFFIPLFGIASLIFFIKMVSITSIIHITFFELLELFIFILPQILFFTLPIVYFASAIAALHRLSYEYETIAFFSLGVAPKRFLFIFAKSGALLSLLLLIFSLVLIPQAKQLYKGFIAYKRGVAKLNIKPSEYGHKFGDWYLFLEAKTKDGYYSNISLYNNKLQKRENFIVAKRARLFHGKEGLKLSLFWGRAYTYEKDTLQEVSFRHMDIFDTSSQQNFRYQDVISYWLATLHNSRRAYDLTLFIFISLFPLLSVPLLITFGILNPRFQRGSIFGAALTTALYFGIAFGLAKALPFYALWFLPIWIVAALFIYKKVIAKRY